MNLNASHLAQIAETDADTYNLARDVRALSPEMAKGRINNLHRIAAFLANVCVETDRLRTLEEYGDKAYFKSFLGGEWRYHGRGYLMNTWEDQYQVLGDFLGVDLIDNLRVRGDEMDPDKLENPQLAAKAAVHFWGLHNVNYYADARNFEAVCSIVNRGEIVPSGPINGWKERVYFHRRALAILPADITVGELA